MPIDPTRLFSILTELEQTSADALKEMDRELLLSIKPTLQEHRSAGAQLMRCYCGCRSLTSSKCTR